MWRVIAAVALCLPTAALAFSLSGGGGGVSKSYVDGQIASIMSAMPQPGNVVPPTDNTVGAVGAMTTRFMREDAVRPARYRSGSCTIAGGAGACTITWSTPFSGTPNPLGDPAAVNTNIVNSQYICNWTAISTTTGTVTCRSSVLGLALLGAILTPIINGTVVYGTAVQPL